MHIFYTPRQVSVVLHKLLSINTCTLNTLRWIEYNMLLGYKIHVVLCRLLSWIILNIAKQFIQSAICTKVWFNPKIYSCKNNFWSSNSLLFILLINSYSQTYIIDFNDKVKIRNSDPISWILYRLLNRD